MFRIVLVWIYLASLLICPLRCAKGLPLDQEPSQVGQHVHCCSGCLHVHLEESNPNGLQSDSVARLRDSGSGFPNSGCGCLTCVCKSTLCSSKEFLFGDIPEQQVAIPSDPQCQMGRLSGFVPDSRDIHCETRPYGRSLRQRLQSWLI
jgi:hypothetical protein